MFHFYHIILRGKPQFRPNQVTVLTAGCINIGVLSNLFFILFSDLVFSEMISGLAEKVKPSKKCKDIFVLLVFSEKPRCFSLIQYPTPPFYPVLRLLLTLEFENLSIISNSQLCSYQENCSQNGLSCIFCSN
jgi:hypothetical protein